ncbi:MAG: hypothetical protein IH944_10905 [Armatimonadetes bacterium]|nr:hypothetical protein [Armatimonadota bacterium]
MPWTAAILIHLLVTLHGVDQDKVIDRNTLLETELISMSVSDQAVRNRMTKFFQSGEEIPPELAKEVAQVDKANRERLKEIVAEHGWPTYALVGATAAHAAWLLVQHSDRDIEFQKKCLALMEPLVEKNQVGKSDFAYLWDRVAVNGGKKQRYGTQIESKDGKWQPKPVEDPKNLDKRRAEVGLSTMSYYLKMFEQLFGKAKG